MLTATPDRISTSDWFKGRVYSVLGNYELKGYGEREVMGYSNYKNISEIIQNIHYQSNKKVGEVI